MSTLTTIARNSSNKKIFNKNNNNKKKNMSWYAWLKTSVVWIAEFLSKSLLSLSRRNLLENSGNFSSPHCHGQGSQPQIFRSHVMSQPPKNCFLWVLCNALSLGNSRKILGKKKKITFLFSCNTVTSMPTLCIQEIAWGWKIQLKCR